jgi:decaprenylphospho-beta-D-erythro-pentofuranosid-2-ulose 2-reductase
MAVAIFGATSRLARRLADTYAAAGYSVFLAARDVAEAERTAADLRIRYGVKVAVGAFDAADLDAHGALVEQAQAQVGPIEVGVIVFGDMEPGQDHADAGRLRRVIERNYMGAAALAEALAEQMVQRPAGGERSIIGVSSVAGERGRASNYLYGSAKGALSLFLQGLRNRLHSQGVHVMTVKLGFLDTRMTFGMKLPPLPVASPEDAAQAIFDAQHKHTDILYYPAYWRAVMGVIGAIPEAIFKRLSL